MKMVRQALGESVGVFSQDRLDEGRVPPVWTLHCIMLPKLVHLFVMPAITGGPLSEPYSRAGTSRD